MDLADVVVRILVAAVLGGAIGLEREIREHTAGFRTHILVAVGAAAFTLASIHGSEGTDFDPNRIAAQVVTGIGFLGAGAIIRYGVTVRGLTTAASLWTVAAVGLLTAQGFFSASLITTAVVIASLYLLRLLEDRLVYRLIGHPVRVRVQFHQPGYAPLAQLMDTLQEVHVTVKEMWVEPGEEESNTIHLFLKLPRGLTPQKLATLLTELNVVCGVRME
ncbi:MAG: MgtC/SapB family protein [Thermoleophilia bacterium]|nr:MgtC/SapB family protein [Thermoleophilia bacterium]